MSTEAIQEAAAEDAQTAAHGALPGSDQLTNSSMGTFRLCRRKYYWCYVMGWRPQHKATPLRLGSAVHLGLDLLARGAEKGDIHEAIDEFYEQVITGLAASPAIHEIEYELHIEAVTVKSLLAGYASAWRDSPLRVVESEKAFDLPIVNPDTGRAVRIFRQAGRRDRLCQLPDGQLALLETKTASEDIGPDSDYRKQLRLNQQITMYLLALKAEGKVVCRVVYDVIRKPTIRPSAVPIRDEGGVPIVLDQNGHRVMTKARKWRTTGDGRYGYVLQTKPMEPSGWSAKLSTDILERPGYYYDRFEVSRLESDLDDFHHELWEMAQDIHQCHRTGRWYRNTDACKRFKRLCPYYPLCASETDVTNGCPAGFRQAEYAHEELAEEEGLTNGT